MLGIPIAFSMGGISIIAGFFLWGGFPSMDGFVYATFGQLNQFVFTAVPLYIFMAGILRYSNLADGMYEAFYRWFGGIKGGLAVGTTIIASLFAAMVGIASVATATLGATARPSMLNRNYDEKLTIGVILAGSGLGILIPPSIVMIIYAMLAEISPGKMFVAGIVPGIMIATMIIIYVLIYCWKYPEKGPALSKEERYSWKEKFESLKGIILPLLVISVVLLSIFLGVATPTEAAAVGVIGSLVSAAINRQLNWVNFKKMLNMTIGLSSMVFWLVIGATAYARIISVTKIGDKIASYAISMDLNSYMLLTIILILFFVFGMFLDLTATLFMVAPVILPLLNGMDFDLVWFGVIFIIMACIANITPPFGILMFILKGVAPDINVGVMYRAVVPMVLLYLLAAILVIVFPEIALWLPNLMSDY